MKKILTLILLTQLSALPIAYAQTSGSGGGYSAPGQVTPSNPTTISPMPVMPPVDSGFLQFNNLTVESVSGTNLPAEILASNPNIYPMMGASDANTGTVAPPAAPSAASGVTCYKFNDQDAERGQTITCPAPKVAPSATTPVTQPASGNTVSPTMYPIRYQSYRIAVDASTRLLLRDRTIATLSDFSAGDKINVFGYYNNDGSIQAYLVRDLSKPAQNEFIQLNNVEIVSLPTGAIPTTIVVAQAQGYPCYGFGANGSAKQSIACPMGMPATSNSPMMQKLTIPASLAPNWQMLRKYVINIDASTIILDTNRTTLSLASLQIGDQLNIYGNTTNNGQTLTADIIRDLSIPATPATYNGKITQINSDGSFVIQTNDGRTITVQNPIQVGATVQVSGLLDRVKNILSEISNINFGDMFRIQKGIPFPAGAEGTPNSQR